MGQLWLWITLGILFIILCIIIPPMLVASIIYKRLLVRTSKEIWGRNCSIDDDDEQKEMYRIGEEWLAKYIDKKKDVEIINDGFHLVGEYIDFGFKKAVIIIAGRMEACHYSYFFAEPYRLSGYNVLVIDNRSHGYSDGKYNTLGIKEYTDVIAWSKMLHDKLDNEMIVLHGICIGSATALYALTSSKCPSYLSGMVADGMYINFSESVKNHIIERNRKVYPILYFFNFVVWLRSGIKIVKQGPINYINKLTKPILFVYSKQDIYSVPEKGKLLFDKCKSQKKLVWFDKGAHSRLRINATERYDKTIKSFLDETFK